MVSEDAVRFRLSIPLPALPTSLAQGTMFAQRTSKLGKAASQGADFIPFSHYPVLLPVRERKVIPTLVTASFVHVWMAEGIEADARSQHQVERVCLFDQSGQARALRLMLQTRFAIRFEAQRTKAQVAAISRLGGEFGLE